MGIFNSLSFDWQARRYVETSMSFFILNGLAFPPPDNTPWKRIGKLAAELSCVDARFVDFADAADVDFGPLPESARSDKRAEIDALVAHAYGLAVDELSFVFTDFTERAVSPAYRRQVLEKFEGL